MHPLRPAQRRYNHAIDFGRFDEWADTFTEDGRFEGPMGSPAGRDQLRQFAADVCRQLPDARHWVNNVVIEGDGAATTLSCYLDVRRVEGGARTVLTGVYCDTLRKVDGGWKFTHRRVVAER